MKTERVVLKSRPIGTPVASDFAIEMVSLPPMNEGEMIVRNHFLSIDPGLRQRLSQEDSYVPLIDIGAPLTGTTVGQVVASRLEDYREGDWIVGFNTLETYSLSKPTPFTRRIDPTSKTPLTHHLSLFGPTGGLTAYFGLLEIGRPRAGETVLVSAAAGSVGLLVGQIARIKGCRVIGICGGSDKCRRLTEEFGLDAAIDYRGLGGDELTNEIRTACPDGVDVYFDNVGGMQLDAALATMNFRGRIAVCGLISQYNSFEFPKMKNLFRIIGKSLRIEGFTSLNYASHFPEALLELESWSRNGKIRAEEEIHQGIDQIVPSFLRLFTGSNKGKTIVELL